MAEERIILTVDDGYCQEKCSCFPIACSAECEHIDKPTFSYTRQEAIEKMNKAACKANKRCIGGKCETCTSKMPHEEYTHQNEAALNALLEVQNER